MKFEMIDIQITTVLRQDTLGIFLMIWKKRLDEPKTKIALTSVKPAEEICFSFNWFHFEINEVRNRFINKKIDSRFLLHLLLVLSSFKWNKNETIFKSKKFFFYYFKRFWRRLENFKFLESYFQWRKKTSVEKFCTKKKKIVFKDISPQITICPNSFRLQPW
jgi:hypothetical protein